MARGEHTPLKAWVLDDPWGERQRAAVDQGWTVDTASDAFELTNRGELRSSSEQHELRKPDLLLIHLFDTGTPRGNRRDREAAHAVPNIICRQLQQGNHVILDAKT
jgi:hypothetical protein